MRSLKSKLAVLVVTAVLSAVALGSLAATWRDAAHQMRSKRDELTGLAAIIATTVSEPLSRGGQEFCNPKSDVHWTYP